MPASSIMILEPDSSISITYRISAPNYGPARLLGLYNLLLILQTLDVVLWLPIR